MMNRSPQERLYFDNPAGSARFANVTDTLERKSLPLRLAELIEHEIKAGSWDGALPGHRTLMGHYSVSAKTCLAAISLLETRGLITAGEQGRKRRILVKPEKTGKSFGNLLIIDSSGYQSGEDLLQIHAYRKAWEEEKGNVQIIRFDFPRYRQPGALLREAVNSHRADALLLHVPPLAWVEAAVKLCPVFLSGGEWGRTRITGCAYHIRDEVARLAEKLRHLGHERIVAPLDLVGRKLEDAVKEGLATGLGLRPTSPLLNGFCPVFAEHVPAALQQYWKRIFASVRPTAAILTTDIHYLSLYGYCFRNGIRIPGDLSIICLESSEHLEWCEPEPTRMSFAIKTAARIFKQWIRGGCLPQGMKFLPLDYLEGATVATAPRP